MPNSVFAPPHVFNDAGQLGQLDPQDGGPKLIQPIPLAPETQVRVVKNQPAALVTRVAQVMSGKGPAIEPKIVRHHTTALARGHVLVHLKAESGHVPKGPDLLAVHTSATTLGAVLKQP